MWGQYYKKNYLGWLFCICLYLSFTPIGFAESTKLYIEGGLHAGGDKIPSNQMEGGEVENSVEAGGLFSAAIGISVPIKEGMGVNASFGMKYNSQGVFFDYSGNDAVTWTVYILNMLVSYRIDEWQLSGGLTYHFSPVLQKNDFGPERRWEFNNPVGYRLELGHIMKGDKKLLAVRVELIEYETEGVTVDGNNIGLIYRYFF